MQVNINKIINCSVSNFQALLKASHTHRILLERSFNDTIENFSYARHRAENKGIEIIDLPVHRWSLRCFIGGQPKLPLL